MNARQRKTLIQKEAMDLMDMGRRSGVVGDYTLPQLKSMGVPTMTEYLRGFPQSEWMKRRVLYGEFPIELFIGRPSTKKQPVCLLKDRTKWISASKKKNAFLSDKAKNSHKK